MAFKQVRNDELLDAIRADVQFRYEPNFAWKSAVSAGLALPALRAFWPMSSVDYAAATQARDVSGGAYHLTNNNSADFGYDNLIPYVEFDGVNQYLSRADGGAGNWADILGTEAYVPAAQRGLTIGCWAYVSSAAATSVGLLSKYTIAGNLRSYLLYKAGDGRYYFVVSTDGTAVVTVQGPTYTQNQWQFVVGRFDPSIAVELYVDGTWYQQLAGVPATINDSTAPFIAGGWEAGTLGLLDGKLSMCFLCAADCHDAQVFSAFHQTKAMFGV